MEVLQIVSEVLDMLIPIRWYSHLFLWTTDTQIIIKVYAGTTRYQHMTCFFHRPAVPQPSKSIIHQLSSQFALIMLPWIDFFPGSIWQSERWKVL